MWCCIVHVGIFVCNTTPDSLYKQLSSHVSVLILIRLECAVVVVNDALLYIAEWISSFSVENRQFGHPGLVKPFSH